MSVVPTERSMFITSDDGSGRDERLAADLFLPDGPGPFASLSRRFPTARTI